MATRAETTTMPRPSGEQVEIAFEGQRVVVTEVGGGLRAYSVDGRQVLDGYDAHEMCSAGRGQVLVPWPNRIAGGSYEFDGVLQQLPVNELETGCAIHGLVRWAAWTVAEREPHRVVMQYDLHAQPGYPFSLTIGIEYALGDTGLRVSTTATNVGSTPCPYGAGAHPYLFPGTPTVDTAVLHVPAASVLEADDNGIPVGVFSVAGTEFDFREPRPVGATKLDHCFSDLERDDDGLARVTLADPEHDTGVSLWVDGAYAYLMLYTGDSRPDVNRRSLAVEPMTCPPNAFKTGEAVLVLEPGASILSEWGISPA
jgi:aldose 1-epimerase